MNWKRPAIFLVLALLVAGAVVYDRTVNRPQEKDELSKRAGYVLPGLEDDKGIERLRVTIKGGTKLRLERDHNRWRLLEPLEVWADASSVNRIASALPDMKLDEGYKAVESSSEKPLDWKQYGLEPPAFTVEAEVAGGKTYRVQVGAKSPAGKDKIYVRVAGGEKLFIVENDLRRALDNGINEFRDRKVLDFTKTQVQRVAVRTPRADFVIARRPAAAETDGKKTKKIIEQWNLESPSSDHAAKSYADRVVDRLSWLEVVDAEHGFIVDDYAKTRAAEFGFDSPWSRFRLTVAKKLGAPAEEMELLVGKQIPQRSGERYALLAGTPHVLAVKAESIEGIPGEVKDLREKQLMSFSAKKVTKVTVKRKGEGKPLVLENVPDSDEDYYEEEEPPRTWKITSPVELVADEEVVNDFLKTLSRAQVKTFLKDKAPAAQLAACAVGKDPLTTVTIERQDGPDIEVLFGTTTKQPRQKLMHARRAGFENIYLVSTDLSARLAARSIDLRNRKIMDLETKDYDHIVLEHRRGQRVIRYEVKKDAGKDWQVVAPISEKADRSFCDGLLSAVAGVKAQKYIAENAGAEELKRLGLAPPAVRVEVAKSTGGAGERKVLLLSEQDDRTRLARGTVEGSGLVWELAHWNAGRLYGQPLGKTVFEFERDDAVSVELRVAGEKPIGYTVERKGEEWSITAPRKLYLDQPKAREFVDRLHYITAERLADPKPRSLSEFALGKTAHLRAKVTMKDGTSHELEIGGVADDQGNRYARSSQRQSVFLVSRDRADFLARKLSDLGASEKPLVKKEEKLQPWMLPRAKISTPQGSFVIELFEEDAPNTTANFVTLVDKKFYDGLKFHRVESWVVQGGDGGEGKPGYRIPFERREKMRKHDYGAVGMARTADYDSADSQFYVITDKAGKHQLDNEYVIFGRVIKGMDVVEGIRKGDPIKAARMIHKRDHKYEVKGKITK